LSGDTVLQCRLVLSFLFLQIFGIVQSTDDFKEQHKVMDGCSDLMMEVFGKTAGYHARSAIGTSTLPLDISVEVEAVVQLKPFVK
jgi:enamine deaminase RidA (YjgF/YER057c/UK114 family)